MKLIVRTAIGLLSIAALIAAHCFVIAMFERHHWKGLSPTDWAAWVQAIGSIAAIIGALVIASKQQRDNVRRDREASKERELNRQRAVSTVVAHCFSVIWALPGPRRGREAYEEHIRNVPRSIFRNLRERLKEAPIYDIQNEKVVTCVLFMMEHMDKTIDLVSQIDALTAQERIDRWQWISHAIQLQRKAAFGISQQLKEATSTAE